MKYELSRVMIRVSPEEIEEQDRYNPDMFTSCSYDTPERYVVKAYCFEHAHATVLFYNDGEIFLCDNKGLIFYFDKTDKNDYGSSFSI
ncbi:MAG: hypothetical protein NZM05_12520 [Chloroherpetonaceae bacterium]|nr:hypothetical protein [Chloroherpetonaceae bacterium]